ncbi:hypothetical protein ZIOFF_049268 [Zingiber officinale]|uniref:Uncharacterized protein n=1 Tax=Zingiber officinale TaxID=94328 RepID=A0A8J5FQZ9_ZINOF|nr:hypothetical protein ZIOFF_049268 [Zingiber officinale]
MEAPDLFHPGFCRAGAAHCGPEKVGGGGEQFVVEDLLDFSNEEEAAGWGAAAEEEGGEGGSDGAAENLTGSSTVTATDSCCNSLSACDREAVFRRSMADAGLPDDFCEPQYDAMAELTKLEFEWAMSDVSEDSFSSKDLHKLHLISGVNSTASSSSSCTATATALAAACQADQVSTFRPGQGAEQALPGRPWQLVLPVACPVPLGRCGWAVTGLGAHRATRRRCLQEAPEEGVGGGGHHCQ